MGSCVDSAPVVKPRWPCWYVSGFITHVENRCNFDRKQTNKEPVVNTNLFTSFSFKDLHPLCVSHAGSSSNAAAY